jgi:FtsH-binding integral membrane protein
MFPDRSTQQASTAASIDAGLQKHMQSVYSRMSLGVLVSAITSYLILSNQALATLFIGVPVSELMAGAKPGFQFYIAAFAPILLVWFGFNPERMAPSQLKITFFLISILYGVSFSLLGIMYTGESIARAFLIASGMFAGLSIFGYVTKKDLSGLASFAFMGVIGALIMGLLNAFIFKSGVLADITSIISIVAFAGITAWQTQSLKETYHHSYGADANDRMAWSGALTLYISFIALFSNLLQLLGNRE